MRIRRFAAVLPMTALVVAAAGCGSATHTPAVRTSVSHPVATTTHAAPAPLPSVYPLTGLPVTNKSTARRPAVAVKVDNVAGAFPQAGLNHADIVADVLVEGGLTRLFAVFQSGDTSAVGPIRSARPVDADLLRLLGPSIFAYSGAAAGEIAPTIQHGDAVRIDWDENPAAFYVESGRVAPHQVFANTVTLYAAATALGARLGPPRAVFSYSRGVPPWRAFRSVQLVFSPAASAGWTWDGRYYLRSQDGSPDVLADGARISADNVVIMSAAVRPTDITDAAGNVDPLDVILGSGRVWVLRNGRMVSGTWSRPNDAAPMRLVDGHGHPITLSPGRTWLEVLPQPHLPVFG